MHDTAIAPSEEKLYEFDQREPIDKLAGNVYTDILSLADQIDAITSDNVELVTQIRETFVHVFNGFGVYSTRTAQLQEQLVALTRRVTNVEQAGIALPRDGFIRRTFSALAWSWLRLKWRVVGAY